MTNDKQTWFMMMIKVTMSNLSGTPTSKHREETSCHSVETFLHPTLYLP